MENPLVNIIMPAYNAERYIKESILSVLEQTYGNWELIIVNDGSIDRTLVIAEHWARQDRRIKVISQENRRLAAARNTGIENAKGDWVSFLDSDDLWEKSKLERQISVSKQQPDIDFIYTGGWIFNEDLLDDLKLYPTIYGKYTALQMYNVIYRCNYIPVLSVMIKAEIITKVKFSEDRAFFYGCEDWDCWLRVCLTGVTFYGIDEQLFYYRRHDSNMSGNGLKMQMAQAAVMLKNYNIEFDDNGSVRVHLKNVINPLISRVIKDGRSDDALFLLDGMASIGHRNSYKLRAWLVKKFGKLAFYPVRVIAKLTD